MSVRVSGDPGLSWPQLTRLGLVQAAIGAVVVLLTTTVNRVIVVELALPATIPGVLVALHFGVQLVLRPRLGHASDRSGRRAPWIVGGLIVCAVGGVGVVASLPIMAQHTGAGVALAALASMVLGAGVSAAGTPLLALMSERARPTQRAGAAAITWILMIVGIICTAAVSGMLLDPFSFGRLTAIAAGIGGVGVVLAVLATLGVERTPVPGASLARGGARDDEAHGGFRGALAAVWGDPAARLFAWFVFVSMFAYSAQDLILEPFAGLAFGMTPGESTALSGMHHGGVLAGMVATAVLGTRRGQLRQWAAAGCLLSALLYVALVGTPLVASRGVLTAVLMTLGAANGMFAIGSIGSMMALTGDAADGRAGVRLGVFGAAQALAYAVGTVTGAGGVDVAQAVLGSPVRGYQLVFLAEAVLFVGAAGLAMRSASRERGTVVFRQHGELLPAVLQS